MFPEMIMRTNQAYTGYTPADRPGWRGQALHLFSNMMTDGKLHRLANTFRRKSRRLLDRTAVICATCIPSRHYAGMMTVAIERIRGSEGRTEDFDDAFYPLHDRLRSRWLNVASVRLSGEELPPVELIRSGGTYFVRDGHHRISVAKALGEKFIEAEVVEESC